MRKQEKPRDQLLGHADEADGIEEYDNPLPDWWLGLFWFTIVWALGYTLHYHFIANRSQVDALAAELAAAEVRWPTAEGSGEFLPTIELASAGAGVFQTNCIACHGTALEGGIGPNLKDRTWIHGSEPQQVLTTIREGIAAKGMPAWGPILGPDRVKQVTAYILTQQSD